MRSAGRFVVKGRWAVVVEHAAGAIWSARLADPASVEDEQVREDGPIILRHHPHEVLLYLLGVPLLGETEPGRDAPDVGVHDDALVHPEGVAEAPFRRLAADAGEGDGLGHGAGNLPAVTLEEGASHALHGAGLVAVEAGGADVFFQLRWIRRGVVLRRAVLLEEPSRDLVHPDVGGLGGEDRRHEQLEGVPPVELGPGVGVLPLEAGYDLGDRGGPGPHDVWAIRILRTIAGHYIPWKECVSDGMVGDRGEP